MSNTKRRDNKGRVLQMGENQLDDGVMCIVILTHMVREKRFTVGGLLLRTLCRQEGARTNP